MSNDSEERLGTNPYESPSTASIRSLRPPASVLSRFFLITAAIVFASGGVVAFLISDAIASIMKERNPWFVVFWPVVLVAFGGSCVLCCRQGVIREIAVIGILINLVVMLIAALIGFVLASAGSFG